jgi:cob(I)alamin adenosyltransferase
VTLHAVRSEETTLAKSPRVCDAVGEQCNPEVIRYLNRLSDTLFILSRAVNEGPPREPSRCSARCSSWLWAVRS